MNRVGDPGEPWRCPPSLVKVFAKRRATQELRRIKGEARAKGQRPSIPELTQAEFFDAYRRMARP